MFVWSEAKVFNSFSGILGSSEEQGVATSGSSQSKLIQSQDLSSSSKNTGTSCSSESKSGNTELGNSQETVIICNSTDDDYSLVVGLLGCVGHNSGDGDWRPVDTGHEESAKDDLVEG